MGEHDDPDDRLLAELRDLLAQADPVPPLVTELAKASLGWRRLDAELAELLSDTALEESSHAGARSAGALVRSVTFVAGPTTIDLEIRVDGERRTLLGQIAPSVSARIEVQTADGATAASVTSDDLGRFRVSGVGAGVVRVLVRGTAPSSSLKLETSWVTI